MTTDIEKALIATKERKGIEFKSEFDPSYRGDWCELIKDIVAIANSGGGVIVIGVTDNGTPSGYDANRFVGIDPATFTDKINSYSGEQFEDFEILERRKGRSRVAVMDIRGVPLPIVFKRPGTYQSRDGKEKIAFREGCIYFRHGAKSAPANGADIRRAFERELRRVRSGWLSGLRKIVTADVGADIVIGMTDVRETREESARAIRLTDDPEAPEYRKIDIDDRYPYRQTELIREVCAKLPEDMAFNSHDATSLWYAHDIGKHGEFYHQPKYGSTQYSREYVEWIVQNCRADADFLVNARSRYRELIRQRR